MKYEIYQVKEEQERFYAFVGFDYVIKNFGKVRRSCYDKVYEGEEENITLDDIFRKFNIERPIDFKGHSLSVSDVVIADGKAFYCDDFGWKEIEF